MSKKSVQSVLFYSFAWTVVALATHLVQPELTKYIALSFLLQLTLVLLEITEHREPYELTKDALLIFALHAVVGFPAAAMSSVYVRGASMSATLDAYCVSVLLGFWASALVQLAKGSLLVRSVLTALTLAGISSYPIVGAALFLPSGSYRWISSGIAVGALAFVAVYFSSQRLRPNTLEAALRVNDARTGAK